MVAVDDGGPTGSESRGSGSAAAVRRRRHARSAAHDQAADDDPPDELCGSEDGSNLDSTVAASRPRLHLLTLQLSPAPLEQRFWDEVGRPNYSRTDFSALLFMAFNLLVGLEQYRKLGKPEYLSLHYGMMIVQVALAVIDIAAAIWITLRPAGYARARDAIALTNRAISCHTLVGFYFMKQPGWRIFTRHGPDMTPEAASGALLRTLFLLGLFWVMHAMLFPFTLRRAAPLQIAVCVAAWFAVRHLACLVIQDAALSAGSQLLCSQVERIKGAILMALGLGLGAAPTEGGGAAESVPSRCAASSFELLVPWFMSLSCFIPITVLYERERILKLRFLRTAGCPEPEDMTGDAPAPLRYTVYAATVLMASSAIADAAARWGRPYTC